MSHFRPHRGLRACEGRIGWRHFGDAHQVECTAGKDKRHLDFFQAPDLHLLGSGDRVQPAEACLLYTSDAADE